MARLIATWSGGKDSCLAMHRAIQDGHEIVCILNTISDEYGRVRFHGTHADHIKAQSECLGIPLVQGRSSGTRYTEDFKSLVQEALKYSPEGIVFGDIHLKDCFLWAKSIADSFDLKLFEPLWKNEQEDLLREFVGSGFKAVVVNTQDEKLDQAWVGRAIDEKFISDIRKVPGIDPSGENGEYHTLVLSGPLFQKSISINSTTTIQRDGYNFLDIKQISIG